MDMPATPENEVKTPARHQRQPFYALVEWSTKRKRLPDWAKMLLLKMVRRRIRVEGFTILRATALQQRTREQLQQVLDNLRKVKR